MKRIVALVLASGLSFGVGALLMQRRNQARHERDLATLRAQFETDQASLQEALAAAQHRPFVPLSRTAPNPAPAVKTVSNSQEVLDRLLGLRVAPPVQGRALRPLLGLLGQLTEIGPPALPVIRQFLATGQDVAYEIGPTKGSREIKVIVEGLVPLSLRLALFDVVQQIGGISAEEILAENLGRSGRGLEVAYLTHLLEEMTPGRYRDAALEAARNLLGRATTEREYLYALLKQFNDTSYVTTAQSQLVQPDGKVDRGALRYLQQTLGAQSVAIAAQAYQEARVIDPESKEPLARLALAYVGASAQAAELFHTAILDQSLKPDQHRNLIEDLNEDGLSNKKQPTAEDLQLIANRYALTQTYLQQDYVQNDKLLTEAFREADKDLRNMLQRAAAATSKKP